MCTSARLGLDLSLMLELLQGLLLTVIPTCIPGTGTSLKNGYSIVVLRTEKVPFSKDFFSNFTPFLLENKEKSELKFTPFSRKTRIFSEILHLFHMKTEKSGLKFNPFFKSNQIKLKLNIFILNRYGPQYTMR